MKKIMLLLMTVFLLAGLSACSVEQEREKPVVLATLFPQYDIARALAGDLIDLELLLPPGADAHTFEPTPRKLVEILDADLLLYTGDTMEPWVANLISPTQNRRLRVLDLSRNVHLIGFQASTTMPDDHNHDHDHEHEDEIGAFELLDRQDGGAKIAYVHGGHWHGSLPNIDVDSHVSLGAHIVSADDRERELDGDVNAVTVSLADGAAEGIVELVNHGDHVHIRGLQDGHTHVVFSWVHRGEVRYTTPAMTVTVGDHDHQPEIGAFELLNRQDGGSKIAYVHGLHWHGSLPIVDVDSHLSLGAHIVSADGRERELDSEGEVNAVTVSLAHGAEEGIVELVNHGDHVHIRGLQNGQTQVVFSWVHRGELRYTTPPMTVTVGSHVHQPEIGAFELLNRQDDGAKIAYVHGTHWHGGLPGVAVNEHLSLGAFIMSADGRERDLDSEGEVNALTVSLAHGASEGIVELVNHGDHVHIRGLQNGQTQVVFSWVHRGELRYTTPPMNVTVSDEPQFDGPFDPHIWMDPLNLAIMMLEVRDALIELLPQHESTLRINAHNYLNDLDALHEDFLDLRAHAELNVIMYGGHNVLGYLVHRYSFGYVNPYRGFSTDAEPTPQALANMIDTMTAFGIEHLFSEKMIAPHVAQAIAQETGAEILYLYALENVPSVDYQRGMTLFEMMQHNLEQLRIGLRYTPHN
ncbi:MAG: hypothetical protein EA374_03225 [Acholeplasmatales bacterium]|nr:MAG: hypothetical protein EA374_03225 [Acholeplasmatales bacterium]